MSEVPAQPNISNPDDPIRLGEVLGHALASDHDPARASSASIIDLQHEVASLEQERREALEAGLEDRIGGINAALVNAQADLIAARRRASTDKLI